MPMKSPPDAVRSLAKPLYFVLFLVAVMLVLTLMNRCGRLQLLTPHSSLIAAAREEFQRTRGEPRFDDPAFLSFGIRPDWNYDRVVAELQRRGFKPDHPLAPSQNVRLPIYSATKRYGYPADPDPQLDAMFDALGVLGERVEIAFDHAGRPLAMCYYYKDVVRPVYEQRAYDFRTGEITKDWRKMNDFLTRGLVPAQ